MKNNTVQRYYTKNHYQGVHIHKDTPISLILLLIKSGSQDEELQNHGIAHFIEHMMFKPTIKFPSSKALNMAIESLGGSSNAFTSHEYTGYYINVLEENFENAFEILAEIIQNGKFDEKDIEIEKDVVCEEIRMYEDSPVDLVQEIAQQNIFPNQGIGRSILGTQETVKSFTKKQILDYIEQKYLSDEFLIVSVGNFHTEKVSTLVEKHLHPRPAGKLPVPKVKFSPANTINFAYKDNVQQVHAVMSFEGVALNSQDSMKMELLSIILGGGMGSLLFDRIREVLGAAYYISASHNEYSSTGIFEIIFGANYTKSKKVVDNIFDILTQIKTTGIHSEDLQRAQNYLFAHYAHAYNEIEFLGQSIGTDILLKDSYSTLVDKRRSIFTIDNTDILNVANNIFNKSFNITYIASEEVL